MKYDAQKLKKIRKQRNLTQDDLHDLTVKAFPPDGVSKSAIRDFECGKKSGTHSIPKIAVALGVPEKSLRKKSEFSERPSRRTA